jgi:predicted exporter
MALFGGEEFIDLLRSDPLHKILDVVDGIVAERNIDNDWITPDGARLLLAESKTRAFDIGAQKQAVQVIRDTLQQQPELQTVTLELAGVGVISTELEQTINQEAQQRSIFASVALALL